MTLRVEDGLGGWTDVVGHYAAKGAKAVGKAAKKGAKAVGKGAAVGARAAGKVASAGAGVALAPVKVAAGAAKAAGKGVKALNLRPPWEGVQFGRPGWIGRLGERLSISGIPVVGVMCNMKRYRNTKACRVTEKVTWIVAKRAVETAYGMPPGKLDEYEKLADSATSKDWPAQRKIETLEKKGVPADVAALVVANREAPSWWEQLLDSLGMR